MLNGFIALVFSATTGLSCDLVIDNQQQLWRISADIETRAYTARSKGKTIRETAMLQVEAGYPEALDLLFNDNKILIIKLNGNAFLYPRYENKGVYVGHCDQAAFEGL